MATARATHLREHNYQAESEQRTVYVHGTMKAESGWGDGAIFERAYRIHTYKYE